MSVSPTKSNWARRFGWAVFALLCAGVAMYAFGFLFADVDIRNRFHVSFADSGLAVPGHFFCAGLALLLAPIQLSKLIRRRWPRLHRTSGLLYVVAVAVAAACGLILSLRAQGGWPMGMAFGLLAVAWIITTALGVRYAVARRLLEHRRWMLRSVALTFAAVTLRIYLALGLFVFELGFFWSYFLAAWLCWTVNLAVMERYLRWRPGQLAELRPHASDTRWVSLPADA